MNSKKAKQLRRDARTYAGSLPPTTLVTLRNGMTINTPGTQRGLYRNLKRAANKKTPSVNAI